MVGSFDNASVTVPLTVNKAASFTSADHDTFTVGVSHSFTVSTSASPTATLSKSGTLPTGVTFSDQGNGTALLQGTPAAGTAGSYPITITASNSAGNPQQSFTLTVQPGAVDDSATLAEDSGASTIDVLANDNSPSGPKTITAKTDGSHGSVAITHSGADLTYTPAANYCGPDSFTYTLNGSSTATVSVTVTCVDDPTTAVDDSATVTEDSGANTIDVRQNDTDIDSAKDPITAVGTAAHGTVAITNSGADLSYAPAANYCGPDSFTYTLSGGSAATVSVTVTCVNDPPRISGGGTLNYTENDGPKQISGTLTVADPEGDTITGATVSISSGYVAGQDSLTWTDDLSDSITRDVSSNDQTLVLTGSGTEAQYQAALRQVSYTNSSDMPDTSPRTVTFSATDAGGATGSGTATVNVASVNDAPAAVADSYATNEDTALTKAAAAGVLSNDTDADGDPLTSVLVSGPSHAASFTLNSDGSFSYTPDANYHGPDSFTYKANDGNADSNVATVSLTVNSVNDAPAAVGDSYSTNEDTALTKAAAAGVLSNDTDADGDPLTSVLVSGPSHAASFTLNSDGSFSYTPDANYHGPDSFTYKANDGNADSNVATVDLTVDAVDDPPVAVNDAATVSEDAPATSIDVIQNDTDTDGGPKVVSSVSQPAHGTAAVTQSGGAVSYTPAANYCGSDSFTYALNGGSTATVSMTVDCVDDPPVATDDHATVAQDSAGNVLDATANDQDVDGGPKQIVALTQPAHGTASIRANGTSLAYTPGKGYCTAPGGAPDTFTYTLNGGSQANVAVSVTCAKTPPSPKPARVSLVVSHRGTALRHGRVQLRLTCKGAPGQRCTGLLTLTATTLTSRLTAAAASSHRHFGIAAGQSRQVSMRPTHEVMSLLRRRGKAVAKLTVALRAAPARTILLTVTP